MNSPVNKIKESLSIEEVISSYIKLDPAGSNLKAKFPFHNEKTPSFFVSPDRGSYYCFGCGASGDIFTFVEEFEGLDFKGALKLLAQRAGVSLLPYNQEDQKNQSEKEKLYQAMEEATKYFENNFPPKADQPRAEKEGKEILEYLKLRGLTDKSIKDFRIGFAINDWRLLYNYLKSKGFTDIEIEKAGLVKKTEKGYYDRFRGRIMFPISDSSGRIIAFSGRLFIDDEKSAKYLNSPDTPIFNKSAVLYGLDKAKESIRKNNFSILVEGQMDLVLSHQAGYKNTVATSGTALSDATISKENLVSNLGLIRRLSPNIVLAFDADKAGFNASGRAGRIALSLGMDVKVVSIPEGLDPADLISGRSLPAGRQGIDAWREVIKNSKHIIEFLLAKILKDNKGDTRKIGRFIKNTVLPYVDALNSSIEKMHFIKRISDETSISEVALQDDLKKIERESKFEKREIEEIKNTNNQVFRKDYIERKLLGIILWQKTLSETSIEVEKVLKELANILGIFPKDVLEKTKENKEDLIFEAEVFYLEDMNLEKDINELLINLKGEYLKDELFKKMQELHIVEEKRDLEKGRQILKEINEINHKIQNIKNKKI